MIKKLKDQTGASILIALLFFLICLAVGGVVVTAASVGAHSVNKEKTTQQAQYDVGCAASTIADQLSSTVVYVDESHNHGVKTIGVTKIEGTKFARDYWSKQAQSILDNYLKNSTSTFSDVSVTGVSNSVEGTMTFDTNLNITVKLHLANSANSANSDSSSYAMTVYLQAVPTYDNGGRLKKIAYEDPVIQKTSDTNTNGGLGNVKS